MKDALGHGSNPRGAHSVGVNAIGLQWTKNKKKNLEIAQRYAEHLGHKAELYPSKGSGVAYYSGGKVVLNSNARYWSDPVGHAARITNLSSNLPEHVIHHEIGHATYDAPDNFFSLSHRDIARQVSQYSAMNPKEFVSEVHAGKVAGKEYSPEVTNLFHVYARPRK